MRRRICGGVALVLLALLLAIESGREFGWSYSDLVCARCGRYRHIERRYGITTVESVDENEVSKWLSLYRSGACKHEWIGFSGGRADGFGFVNFDGMSPWHDALRQIHRLDPVIGEAETKKLLDRYYEILDVPNRGDQHVNLRLFRKELEDQSLAAGLKDRDSLLHTETETRDLSAVGIEEQLFHPAQDGRPATLYLVLTAEASPRTLSGIVVQKAQEALDSLDEHGGSGPNSKVVFFIRLAKHSNSGTASAFSRAQLAELTQLPEGKARWKVLEHAWALQERPQAVPDD
jgi:hypothetical protein